MKIIHSLRLSIILMGLFLQATKLLMGDRPYYLKIFYAYEPGIEPEYNDH